LVARGLKFLVVCFRLDGGRTPDVHFNTVLTWDISCLLVLPLYGSSGQVTFSDFKTSCSWRKSKFHYCGSWCRETTTRGAVANTTAALISYLGRGKRKDSCLTGNSRRHTTPTKRFLKHHSDSIVMLQKRKSKPINAQPS
jgi:hypothetical protein